MLNIYSINNQIIKICKTDGHEIFIDCNSFDIDNMESFRRTCNSTHHHILCATADDVEKFIRRLYVNSEERVMLSRNLDEEFSSFVQGRLQHESETIREIIEKIVNIENHIIYGHRVLYNGDEYMFNPYTIVLFLLRLNR